MKVVVLLGESGVGKPSIGNRLLSLYFVEGFAVSRRTDSCKKTTSEISVASITNRAQCAIIFTPGLNGSNIENTDHIRGMVQFLRQRGTVYSFLLVRNEYNIRTNHF